MPLNEYLKIINMVNLDTFDLCSYRDPEEIGKDEQATAEKTLNWEELQGEWIALASEFTATQSKAVARSEGMQVHFVPIQQFPA